MVFISLVAKSHIFHKDSPLVSPVGFSVLFTATCRDHSSGHHRKGLPGATSAVPEVGGLAATQLGIAGDHGIGLAFGKP